MTKPGVVFKRIEETKIKIKEITQEFKETCLANSQYAALNEQAIELRAKMRLQTAKILSGYEAKQNELDALKTDLDSDKQLLTDILLNKLTKGEQIEFEDEHRQLVLPIFAVKFNRE